MFIFDVTTVIFAIVCFVITYAVLEYSNNQNFQTMESKIFMSLGVAVSGGLFYSYFIAGGTETLLSENFVDAGNKFGTVSGMDSIKAMADI
jgi:hypothetical protein